jgi:hypothetical protein
VCRAQTFRHHPANSARRMTGPTSGLTTEKHLCAWISALG